MSIWEERPELLALVVGDYASGLRPTAIAKNRGLTKNQVNSKLDRLGLLNRRPQLHHVHRTAPPKLPAPPSIRALLPKASPEHMARLRSLAEFDPLFREVLAAREREAAHA